MAITLHFDETEEFKLGDGDDASIFTLGVIPMHKRGKLVNQYLRFVRKIERLESKQEKLRKSAAEKANYLLSLEGAEADIKDLRDKLNALHDEDKDAREALVKEIIKASKKAEDDFKSAIGEDAYDDLQAEIEDLQFDVSEIIFSDEFIANMNEFFKVGVKGWRNVYSMVDGKKRPLRFATDENTLGILGMDVLRSVAIAVINFNTLSEEDQGN